MEKIRSRDLNESAEYVIEEYRARKSRRKEIEEKWDEVDRQLAICPDERNRDERDDAPLVEPPNQAQALEMLTSDTRMMLFPTDRRWFFVNADFDKKIISKIAEDGLIAIEEEGIVQKTLDDIVHATQSTNQELYDFRGAWDVLNAEAFKYGHFAGRVRLVKKEALSTAYRGPHDVNERIPMLVPYSIRHTYLDDTLHHQSREGIVMQPSTIRRYYQRPSDIKLAAKLGEGWIPSQVRKLDDDKKNDKVLLLEFEGDLYIGGREYSDIIVTVADGSIIRMRDKSEEISNLIAQPYHIEGTNIYGTSPLVKGVPVQMGMAHAMQRVLQAAIKNAKPPCRWDSNDPYLSAKGGPDLSAGAVNEAITNVDFWVHGDLNALSNIYLVFLRQYEELTGVTSPRLGAQTKSHQTAFAVDQEISRGQTRTVDYVRSVMKGAMTSFLHIEYELLRKNMPVKKVFVESQGGWITVKKSYLPERVRYNVVGAAGPGEERLKQQQRMQALTMLFNAEQVVRALGGRPIDLDQVRQELLKEAGFTDVERFFGTEQAVPPGTQTLGTLPAVAQGV